MTITLTARMIESFSLLKCMNNIKLNKERNMNDLKHLQEHLIKHVFNHSTPDEQFLGLMEFYISKKELDFDQLVKAYPFIYDFFILNTFSKESWKKVISLSRDFSTGIYLKLFEFRHWYCANVSWSIITTELLTQLKEVVKDKKVLDAGCGVGYLTSLLRKEKNCDLTAIDNKTYNHIHQKDIDKEIINGNYLDLPIEDFDIVILSWPVMDSSENPNDLQLLKRMKSNSILIYIGEGSGGCTGSENFHDYIYEYLNIHNSVEMFNGTFISFEGIYDSISIYQKSN